MLMLVPDLGDAIAAVFASMPASKEIAALGLANAYHDYCELHLFNSSHGLLLGEFRDLMADTLAIALTLPGAPPTIANAFATAVDVYWGSIVPVPVVGLSGSGVVEGCPGAPDMVGPLTAVFANLFNSYASAGLGVASALDTATRTVKAKMGGDVMVPIS